MSKSNELFREKETEKEAIEREEFDFSTLLDSDPEFKQWLENLNDESQRSKKTVRPF